MKLLKNFLAVLDAGTAFSTSVYPPLDLPLVNQDVESKPLDPRVLAFQAAVRDAPVIVAASPEYNGSVGGVFKNAIDWATRPEANLWKGKVMVLLSASPGALGGARGLITVRTVLSGLGAWIIPEQVQLPAAHKAFDEQGALQVDFVKKQMQTAAQSLEIVAKKMLS